MGTAQPTVSVPNSDLGTSSQSRVAVDDRVANGSSVTPQPPMMSELREKQNVANECASLLENRQPPYPHAPAVHAVSHEALDGGASTLAYVQEGSSIIPGLQVHLLLGDMARFLA